MTARGEDAPCPGQGGSADWVCLASNLESSVTCTQADRLRDLLEPGKSMRGISSPKADLRTAGKTSD